MKTPTNLFDYVQVGNVFDNDTCNLYLERLSKKKMWKPHQWFQNAAEEYTNKEDFNVTYDADISNNMMEPVLKFAEEYFKENKEGGGSDTSFSGVRFNRYNVGESITPHTDHIHSIFDGTRRGIPVLSFVGVFNDDYEGGDFMLCGEKIDLKKGDAVIFPSVFLYPHWVTTVTKGTRYSWVMWSW